MRNNQPAKSTPAAQAQPNGVVTPTFAGQRALADQMTKQEWSWCAAERKFRNALETDLALATKLAGEILKRELKIPAASGDIVLSA